MFGAGMLVQLGRLSRDISYIETFLPFVGLFDNDVECVGRLDIKGFLVLSLYCTRGCETHVIKSLGFNLLSRVWWGVTLTRTPQWFAEASNHQPIFCDHVSVKAREGYVASNPIRVCL